MARFAYEAVDGAGQRVRGVETAIDESDLDRLLERRELLLVRAQAGRAPRRRRASTRTLIDFCYHLGTIVQTGIPILDGLRDLHEGGRSPIAAEIEDMTRRVESGQRLSEALGAHPGLFPDLVRSLVSAGEESGNLDEIFLDLSRYLEWREDLRRKISAATTYPCIVVVALVGLLVLLTTVVLPRFLTLFSELNVELPLATRVILEMHQLTVRYGLAALLVLGISAVSLVLYVRTEPGRRRFHALQLRAPLLGKLVTMLEMARLSHNLGLLYRSGIPILRGLQLVEQIVQNRLVRDVVTESRSQVSQGESLTQALGRADLVPPMVMRMISLGETSGRLDASLEHVSRYYDREVPTTIERTLGLFNAGAVVILGCVLGTVALAIFVPLYRMLGNLNA